MEKKGKKKTKWHIYSKCSLTSPQNKSKSKNSKRVGLEHPESSWLFHLYTYRSMYFDFLFKGRKDEMEAGKVLTYEYFSLINLFNLSDRITTQSNTFELSYLGEVNGHWSDGRTITSMRDSFTPQPTDI